MKKQIVCPWWMGYSLILPIRKWINNPVKILSPYIQPGMTVMDYGCAMGYFSIPMAQMTGEAGKVYCVDIQPRMLQTLRNRAIKKGVHQTLIPLIVGDSYAPQMLKSKLDFVLLFAVVHEVSNQQQLFDEIYDMLKEGGKVLMSEPKGHVSKTDFDQSVALAIKSGFKIVKSLSTPRGLCIAFEKNIC